jgi:hypothetical protein
MAPPEVCPATISQSLARPVPMGPCYAAGGVMPDRRHRRLTATEGARSPAVWLPGCLRLALVHFGQPACRAGLPSVASVGRSQITGIEL